MQNFSSFGPFREKIGSNSQNSGRQLQQNEGRSPNLDKSLFIIGPKEAVSSSGLKKGAPQFQLGTIVYGYDTYFFELLLALKKSKALISVKLDYSKDCIFIHIQKQLIILKIHL